MKQLMVICLAAASMAACSAGGGADATTSPPTVAPTVAETSPATSSAAPTTTAPPTTTSTTTVPSTTLAPTTTVETTEDLIKQAVQDYIAAYLVCGQAPTDCDPATFTASLGKSRSTVASLISGMIREGLRFSTDLRGSHFNPTTVQLVGSSEATVESCWYDAGIVLGPVGPDGQPTVVNDQAGSSLYLHTLFLEAGVWKVGEQQELSKVGVEDTCTPAL